MVLGTSGQPIADLTLEKVGSTLEITPDFSAVSAATATVEVLNAGTSVGSAAGHAGLAATVPSDTWPTGLGVLEGDPNLVALWASAVSITVPGVGVLVGDELRMTAESADASTALESVELLASDVPDFTIIGGSATTPPTVPAVPGSDLGLLALLLMAVGVFAQVRLRRVAGGSS